MFKLFLPIIIVGSLIGGIFRFPYGAQIEGDVVDWGRAPWIVPGRIYQIHIKFDECDDGTTFNCPSHYDQDIEALAGNDIIVNVKVVPKQFRLYPDNSGSPPTLEYCSRIGFFLNYLQTKYPTITIFDLFNEPDVPLEMGKEYGQFLGAWVIDGDYYNSGKYYGECVQRIADVSKGLNSRIKIMIGALIGADTSFDFIKGALEKTDNYDAVSFHKYLKVGEDFDIPFKYADKLSTYTNKPLVMTETSILGSPDSEELQTTQAQYISYLIYNQLNSKITAWLWYSLANNGWYNSDLVFDNIPKPSYYAYAGYPGVGGGEEEANVDYLPVFIVIFVILLLLIGFTLIYYDKSINKMYDPYIRKDDDENI